MGALELCCAIAFAKASKQMATAISEILEFLEAIASSWTAYFRPSFLMRVVRVLGLIPSSSAAPPGP